VFLPLLNGNKGLFKDYFNLFWNHIPLAQSFRTFIKLDFIILYVLSFMVGMAIDEILNKNKSLWVKMALVLIFIYPVCIYYSPLLREGVFVQDRIPEYYYEMKEKFKQPLVANTMITPQTNWLVTYDWRKAEKDTDNILPYFYNGYVYTNGAAYEHTLEYQHFNNTVSSYMFNGYLEKIGNVFSYRNINYIVLQEDIAAFLDFKEDSRSTVISNINSQSEFFKRIYKFGKISICEIPEKYYSQKIFSPGRANKKKKVILGDFLR